MLRHLLQTAIDHRVGIKIPGAYPSSGSHPSSVSSVNTLRFQFSESGGIVFLCNITSDDIQTIPLKIHTANVAIWIKIITLCNYNCTNTEISSLIICFLRQIVITLQMFAVHEYKSADIPNYHHHGMKIPIFRYCPRSKITVPLHRLHKCL